MENQEKFLSPAVMRARKQPRGLPRDQRLRPSGQRTQAGDKRHQKSYCYTAEEGGEERGSKRRNSRSRVVLRMKLARLALQGWADSPRREKSRLTQVGVTRQIQVQEHPSRQWTLDF